MKTALRVTGAALLAATSMLQAGSISADVVLDLPFSPGPVCDPVTNPALIVTGTWSLTPGDPTAVLQVPGLDNWSIFLRGAVSDDSGDAALNVLSMDGQSVFLGPSSAQSAAIGLVQIDGTTGVADLPPTSSGACWSFTGRISGNAFLYEVRVSVVPEPGTLALFGLGAFALVARRRVPA